MSALYDHISPHSETALRKTLRASLEEQFEQVKTLVDELCDKMYTKIIPHEECAELYKEIKCLLSEINSAFTYYAESRKCAIGVDTDGDISFVKQFLEEYKHQINQLKEGIKEAKQHECRFDVKSKQESIAIYQLFSSRSENIAEQFDILQRQYNELECDVYGPQSDEVVLNRFNRHFYDVAQSVESGLRKVSNRTFESFCNIDLPALKKSITESLTRESESSAYNLFAKIFSSFEKTKKKEKKKKLNNVIREEQIELFTPLWTFLDGRFIELYNKPQELAREIYDQQIDNEQVEDMMTRLCLWKHLEDTKAKYASSQASQEDQPSQQEQETRRRGRPTVENFYEKYLDLDRLGDFIRETFKGLYGLSIEDDIRVKGKKCYIFLSILLIALNGGSPQKVMGKIACFCRYVKKTFGILGRSLRSFQMYISGIIAFLGNRLKSSEGDEEAMKKSALKAGTLKFYEGVKLLSNRFHKIPVYVREAIDLPSLKRPRMTYFLSQI